MIKDSLAEKVQMEPRLQGGKERHIAVWLPGLRQFPDAEGEQAPCSEHSQEGRVVEAK